MLILLYSQNLHVLKLWRNIKNRTPSVDAPKIPEEQWCKFHPDTIWNDEALGFLIGSTQPEEQEQLEVRGRARREAAQRRKSECKVNLGNRNSSDSNGS